MTDDRLARSRRELEAAEVLETSGFHTQAVSRAYFAAFYAAEAAISMVGETRRSHSGLISAFIRIVVKDRGLDAEAGTLLRALFQRRLEADYVPVDATEDEARTAIQRAKRFVNLTEQWFADQS